MTLKHLKAAKASSVAAVALGSRSLALPRASDCRSAACAMLLAPLLTALACAETADAFRLVCSTRFCVLSTYGHPCGTLRATRRIQRHNRLSDNRGTDFWGTSHGGCSNMQSITYSARLKNTRYRQTRERCTYELRTYQMPQGCDVPGHHPKSCFGTYFAKIHDT